MSLKIGNKHRIRTERWTKLIIRKWVRIGGNDILYYMVVRYELEW